MISTRTPAGRRALAAAAFLLLLPAAASAQTAAGRLASDSTTAQAAAAPPAAPSAPAVVVLADAGTDGFGLRSSDGAFRLRLQGVGQYDARAFPADDDDRAINGFDVRRVRADLRGTVYSQYDFRVNLDYAGNRVDVLDAYLEGRFSPALQIRAGKFKAPVGLERLQSVSALTFPERAFPTALVPNRDVGLQIAGGLGGSRLSYALGVFNGVPDGGSADADLSDSKDLAARLFVQPFAGGPAALRGLGFGVAGTIGEQSGSVATSGLPSLRTTIGRSTFLRFRSDGTEGGSAALDGRRTRISPQGWWYLGPVGVLGEYVRSTSDVRIAEEVEELTSSAWQVAGSWVLTGEAASYRGVSPARPFEPSSGGWGAVELAARVHAIEVDEAAFPLFINPVGAAAEATAYTLGLNWYLNRFVRLQAHWERTDFTAAPDAVALDDENVLITRFQVAF